MAKKEPPPQELADWYADTAGTFRQMATEVKRPRIKRFLNWWAGTYENNSEHFAEEARRSTDAPSP